MNSSYDSHQDYLDCIESENKQLRELNSEMLAALIRAEPWISRDVGIRSHGLAHDILKLIAKAEKLK